MEKEKKEISKFLLRIEDKLKKKIQNQAESDNRSLNGQIIHILEKYLTGGR